MKHLFTTLFCFNMFWAGAQNYFQQEVNYTISVQLYDKENMLRGNETFEYVNNSPDELSFIYVHLWPNAYKNNKTALAKQLYDMNNMSLEYASAEDRGFIDSLDFKVNREAVEWEFDEEHPDICKIMLKSPLKPGEKMSVSTPFRVKIPSGSISRLGFVGESYQITQWYPKPAVYDQEGWHEMPYLTQGEFYSEYGSFDVSITLPENYVVAATGDLQTESEIEFLLEKAEATAKKFEESAFDDMEDEGFPESSEELKTIRFTQENVHDFGWFADKRYEVLTGEVELPNSGEKVKSWSMFTPKNHEVWENSIEYLNDAIFYYSKWNGDYPYKHVTAVDGTISAGGGMEYPNVTVIGTSSSKEELEVVIVHEVGHNWFYGLLGSNERDHAWMDEGLNTLNEIRYMETKYPNNTRMSDMAGGVVEKLHFEDLGHQDMSHLTYALVASYGLDQPIELHSAEYSSMNYGAIVYAKTGLVFMYVKDYLGDEEFDRIMQKYYEEWHYKHPQPEDLKAIFEKETGKEMDWLFEDLIKTTKQIDYKIAGVKKKDGKTIVKVRNVGQIDAPVRVDALSLGKVRETKWIEPGEKVSEVTFEGTSYDQFVIDYDKQMPEIYRNNNYWSKGLFSKIEPFKLEFLGGDNEGESWNNYWMPMVGGNVYDQFMVGAVFHNQMVPKSKWTYTLAPLYSFGRNDIAGIADINYSWVPAKNIQNVKIGVHGKTFGNGLGTYDANDNDRPADYYTVQPYLTLDIGKPAHKSKVDQQLSIEGHYILEQGNAVDNLLTGGTMKYDFGFAHRIHNVHVGVQLDYFNVENRLVSALFNRELMNLGVEAEYQLEYWDRKNKHVRLRGFLGQNLFWKGPTAPRYSFSMAGQSGTQDVTYQNYMFGRNRNSGFWSNQRLDNQGGFKMTSGYGTTSGTLAAANLYFELPIPLLGVFADYGVFSNSGTYHTLINTGIGIELSKRFGVYFPIYQSDNIVNSYSNDVRYGEKIRFSLDLSDLSLNGLLKEAF